MAMAGTWQKVAMAMADVWQKVATTMAEVWQSEEGSSRSAEHQGSGEKKATGRR